MKESPTSVGECGYVAKGKPISDQEPTRERGPEGEDETKQRETEPAPLPPSPLDRDVSGWFDSQPTFTDPRLVRNDGKRAVYESGQHALDVTTTRAHHPQPKMPRGLLVLVAAASLAVGILIGTLAFGQLVHQSGADECECTE